MIESRDPRTAGDVLRYHTWRTIQQQTNAAHSWQVARILLAIWPSAPREVLIQTLMHDIGEVVSGDLPYPVKRENPDLKAACDRIETAAHLAMCAPWGVPPPQVLTNEARAVIKLAEYLEMAEFGMVEEQLGNVHGTLIVSRCLEAVNELCNSLREAYPSVVDRSIWYLDHRSRYHRNLLESNSIVGLTK